MDNSERANAARSLADFAQELLPHEELQFDLDEQFRGRESEIIEGAKNILTSEGDGDIKLSIGAPGVVNVSA